MLSPCPRPLPDVRGPSHLQVSWGSLTNITGPVRSLPDAPQLPCISGRKTLQQQAILAAAAQQGTPAGPLGMAVASFESLPVSKCTHLGFESVQGPYLMMRLLTVLNSLLTQPQPPLVAAAPLTILYQDGGSTLTLHFLKG